MVGRSHRYGALAVEFLVGAPLDAAGTVGSSGPQVAAAGRALARVHGCPPVEMPPVAAADPASTGRLVGTLLPHLRERTERVLATLAAHRPPPGPSVACHGDFSLDQVVAAADGSPSFIDWDRSGAGNAAADLGSLVASGAGPDTLAAFFGGYEQLRPLPPHLGWYTAEARLRRLAEPFRTASPHWVSDVERQLHQLEEPWT